MSHKEPNDYDEESWRLLTECPGITDLDPEQADRERDALFYPGDFIGDAQIVSRTTISEDLIDLAIRGQELEALRAMPEPPNLFDVARQRNAAEAMEKQIDHVAAFYARK